MFVQRHRDKFRGWAMLDGRRVYGPSRSDATEAHDDAMAMRKKATRVPADSRTIGELFDEMLADLAELRSAGTVEFYRQQGRAIFRFLARDLALAEVTPIVLRELIRRKLAGHYSAQTVQHHRRTLSRFFGWAKRRGLLQDSPVELVDWPQPQPAPIHVLSEAELRDVLSMVSEVPEDFDLMLVVLFTGLRRAELAKLRVADVDVANGLYWVDGKRRREACPITNEVRAALLGMVERARQRADDFVVPRTAQRTLREPAAQQHERERAYTIANLFRRWSKRAADKRLHPHAMRHSLATAMIRAGVDPVVVQRTLRHRSYATTARYVHLVAEDVRGATARLRFLPGGDEATHGSVPSG